MIKIEKFTKGAILNFHFIFPKPFFFFCYNKEEKNMNQSIAIDAVVESKKLIKGAILNLNLQF